MEGLVQSLVMAEPMSKTVRFRLNHVPSAELDPQPLSSAQSSKNQAGLSNFLIPVSVIVFFTFVCSLIYLQFQPSPVQEDLEPIQQTQLLESDTYQQNVDKLDSREDNDQQMEDPTKGRESIIRKAVGTNFRNETVPVDANVHVVLAADSDAVIFFF